MPVYFFQMADSETPKVDQVVGEDDDDDPAIIITWAADDVIRDAMALPESGPIQQHASRPWWLGSIQ